MLPGHAAGRHHRARWLYAASAGLVLLAAMPERARSQSVTDELLRPVQGDFAATRDLPLRPVNDPSAPPNPNFISNNDRLSNADQSDPDKQRKADAPAPSRIGKTPVYGTPAASGASASGFDSLNRKRKKVKPYPGAPKPPVPLGPGSAIPSVVSPTLAPPPIAPPPSATANKPPIAPALAGTIIGQPLRKRLKSDDDPFGAVGDYAGSFLIKSAVETTGGYDSNPGRLTGGKGSSFYVVAPEFLAVSDWERHALVADLRGSYTGYGSTFPATVPCDCTNGTTSVASPIPTSLDRPDFTGHIDGRLDVSHDTHILAEARLRLSTDNPGSPNIQVGLSKYPVFTTTGGSVGLDQSFNRLQITAVGNVDRTVYQNSVLTDGTSATNDDRNFNQYGGVTRVSYDLMPGLKPFGEFEADERVHDLKLDRFGYMRDSTGGYAKAGSSFELTRLLTGEFSVGYTARDYVDPRLNRLSGFLTSASLTYAISGLTTAKLITDTSVDETTLPGVSGVLTRTYTAEVDHDFRRWLTGIGKFTYGTLDYQGSNRSDKLYSLSADLIWKLNRSFWVKAEIRQDRLDSNAVGFSSVANVATLGIRLQN